MEDWFVLDHLGTLSSGNAHEPGSLTAIYVADLGLSASIHLSAALLHTWRIQSQILRSRTFMLIRF